MAYAGSVALPAPGSSRPGPDSAVIKQRPVAVSGLHHGVMPVWRQTSQFQYGRILNIVLLIRSHRITVTCLTLSSGRVNDALLRHKTVLE